VTLPALAAERHLLLCADACSTAPAAHPQLSIDISCPQGAQQQTLPVAVAAVDRWDNRETDRRPTVTRRHTQTLLCILRDSE